MARFSADAENLIHSDPEVAQSFGYKAPIAGGVMAVHFMMAHLWRDGPLEALEMSVKFRRPMYWDDELALGTQEGDENCLAVLRTENGKVAAEAKVSKRVTQA